MGNWLGTKQRDNLKNCPFCGSRAIQQVRIADSDTGLQFRIGCGNSFCGVDPNTPPYAALAEAEMAWQCRDEEAIALAGSVAKEEQRKLDARLMRESLELEKNKDRRMAYAIAEKNIQRGWLLTAREQMENLERAMLEAEDEHKV